VFEHIEPEYADALLDNLCLLSRRHLISAAPPGQKGHFHVNCQPMSYWEEKYARRGYTPRQPVVDAIREKIAPWKSVKGIKAWYENLAYFERG